MISPLKKTWPFIWANLNAFNLRTFCANFDWNWLCGSEEENENAKSFKLQQQRRRRKTPDTIWSEKLTGAFDSGELITNAMWAGCKGEKYVLPIVIYVQMYKHVYSEKLLL